VVGCVATGKAAAGEVDTAGCADMGEVGGVAIAAGGTGAGTADVLSFELLLNTVDLVAAFGAGAGVGAGSGSAWAACLSGARSASSELGGNCCAPNAVEFTTLVSSRSLT
jgi:hypothetical protein